LRTGRKQAILPQTCGHAEGDRPPNGVDQAVISPLSFRRAAVSAIAVVALTWSAPLVAQSQLPTTYSRTSVSGSFLAARHASVERDASAAATHYRAALRGDPRNGELLSRAFLAVLANGEVEEAVKLAERVIQADKNDRIARLVLGVRAIKQKQYPAARQQLAQTLRAPVADLAGTLLSAWTQASATEYKAAIDSVDKLVGPDWYNIFKSLHSGMILDAAGQKRDAGKRLERAYQFDKGQLRIVQAYGNFLARQGTKEGRDEALKVYRAFDDLLPNHPLITEAINDLNTGKRLPLLADSPQLGAAEVLYGLGSVLGRRGGEDLGLIYLQLALYLAPGHPMALLSLADFYEGVKKHELAVKVYERVPVSSPLYRSAQIQRAMGLDALERSDEAKSLLDRLIADNPTELEAITAQGNVLRGRKQFAECADVYAKGINGLGKPERSHWTIYYFRGICYERSKQWPRAEADFKKSLELFPDQPLVLNYLGYSWVDQGVHLDEGMRMIQRAVEQRADDGYIVDSLGWAYYRIGQFDEAVKHLEHAVELKPEDPTINDHLGDAYWKVGRVLEARFQWSHARDLKPEPDELAKIEDKLKGGMPEEAADVAKTKRPGGG
jgi:tetratricopeptide (TPR) repeat protein